MYKGKRLVASIASYIENIIADARSRELLGISTLGILKDLEMILLPATPTNSLPSGGVVFPILFHYHPAGSSGG